jgi:hypothetical protein
MKLVICTVFLSIVFSAYSQQQKISLSRKYTKAKRHQFIDFDYLGKVQIEKGEIFMELRRVSSCGLPVKFESSNHSVAVVKDSKLIIRGAGFAKITATQRGNKYFQPASEVMKQIYSNPMKQVIEFRQIDDLPLDHEPLNITATSSSGLPVKFSTSSSSIKISGSRVVFVKEGDVFIKATQQGNKLFLPAESTIRFKVLPSRSRDQHLVAEPERRSEDSKLISRKESGKLGLIPLELFPNPADEKLHIELGEMTENAELLVYDARGNEILDRTYKEIDRIVIELDTLMPGMYFVIVRNQKAIYTDRFIKK